MIESRKVGGMRARTVSALLAAIVIVSWAGCGRESPNEERIVGAIARSDSLNRQVRHRFPQSWQGYPVARSSNADSVAWLNATAETLMEVH